MMQKVTDNLYQIASIPGVNMFLIVSESGLSLVDTGMGIGAGRVLKQIQAQGHNPTDIQYILMTHEHDDHIGGMAKIQAATQAEVWSSPESGPHIPATIAREVQEGATLAEIWPGLAVVASPGHRDGHLSFWHADQKVLIVGDAMFHVFGRLSLPLKFASEDMDEARRSVRKLIDLEPEILVFGHGPAITKNAQAELAKFAARIGV